jgi:hypothetical protein
MPIAMQKITCKTTQFAFVKCGLMAVHGWDERPYVGGYRRDLQGEELDRNGKDSQGEGNNINQSSCYIGQSRDWRINREQSFLK